MINYVLNQEGVLRTARARPGLLTTLQSPFRMKSTNESEGGRGGKSEEDKVCGTRREGDVEEGGGG